MNSIALPGRPLVGISFLFLAGTAAGMKLGGNGWYVALIALGAVSAAISWAWRTPSTRMASLATAAAICCAGLFAGAVTQRGLADEHVWLARHAQQPVYIRGVVDRPSGRRPPGKFTRRPFMPLRNVVIESDSGTYALAQTRVWVKWYGSDCQLSMGETWAFRTRLPRLESHAYTPYLSLNSRVEDAVRLTSPSFWDWRPLAERTRRAAARRLSLGIDSWPVVPKVIQAMLLGTRSEIPWEINAVFRDSGTIHIFAISGLGIGLVAAVMVTGLAFLGVPRHRWGVPLVPLLTIYTLLTGASPSAMRACLMASVYFSAPLFGRKPDAPSALGAAAVLQIAWCPNDLFNLSFILSYTAMAGLILLYPPLFRLGKKWLGVGSAARTLALYRLAQRLTTKHTRLSRQIWAVRSAIWRHWLRLYLAGALAVSLAAWLASVPLTAYHFGRFTPGGLLANLVVVPAAFLITISGALAILTSFVSCFVAEVFNHTAACCAAVMVATSRLTVAIPGATFHVPQPPVTLLVAWYIGLLALVWRLRTQKTVDGTTDTEDTFR